MPLRNSAVTGSGRAALCIDPGKEDHGHQHERLQLRVDWRVPGHARDPGRASHRRGGPPALSSRSGVSDSPSQQPIYDPAKPSSFNNAAGWYDDMADGPVNAHVTVGGRDFEADGAWVTSAPPNFAPDFTGWRNLDDLFAQRLHPGRAPRATPAHLVQRGRAPDPGTAERVAVGEQGVPRDVRGRSPLDFDDKELMRKLSFSPESSLYPDPYAELRRTVYNSFRSTAGSEMDMNGWPPLYGDTFGYSDAANAGEVAAQQNFRLPDYYDYVLSAWVAGRFVGDYKPDEQRPETIDDVDLQRQPEMLGPGRDVLLPVRRVPPGL